MNNNVKNFHKSKSMAATLKLPEAVSALGKDLDMDWKIMMGKGTETTKKDEDRTVEQIINMDVLALLNKLAVSRAVMGLQNLTGKRLGTQWESLLSKATDRAGLARSVVKWWTKKSPVEQSEAEVDFPEWVSSIRDTWGECDAAKEKLEVPEKINKAMEKWVGIVRGEGKELDRSELVLEATKELTSRDNSQFTTMIEGLLVDLP